MPKSRRRRINEETVIRRPIITSIKTAATRIAEMILATVRTTPIGVVLIAVIAFFQVEVLPGSLVAAIPIISYMTLIFGMTITSCFNRSRAFFILLTLFLSQLGLGTMIPAHINKVFALQGIYAMTCLLLPLNLLFFSSRAERGILSSWGQRYFMFIFLQVAAVLAMIFSDDQELLSQINGKFIAFSFMPQTPIPDVAIIAFLISGLLLLVRRRRTNAHFKTAVFGTLIAIAFAQHFKSVPIAIPLFYAAAGLIMIVAVIQDYYFKAYLDELTGLPSRRSLNEDMLALEGTYVIAMLDVDFFKKFNDTYGHDAGDDVLRLIAGVMKNFKAGKSFRYGGEEFTILFPNKSLAEAIAALEKLRESIAKCKFALRGSSSKKAAERKLNITVSIGVAESNHKLASPEEVIKAADTALYRAKDNGRNCVST
ncbi:MAG TPA: GGDEF domain-containing protein [Negativicutes bacterium]